MKSVIIISLFLFLISPTLYYCKIEVKDTYDIYMFINDVKNPDTELKFHVTKTLPIPSTNANGRKIYNEKYKNGFYLETDVKTAVLPKEFILLKDESGNNAANEWFIPYRNLQEFTYSQIPCELSTVFINDNSKKPVQIKFRFESSFWENTVINEETGNHLAGIINSLKVAQTIENEKLLKEVIQLGIDFNDKMQKTKLVQDSHTGVTEQKKKLEDEVRVMKETELSHISEFKKGEAQIQFAMTKLAEAKQKKEKLNIELRENEETIAGKKKLVSELKNNVKVALEVLTTQVDNYRNGLNCKMTGLSKNNPYAGDKLSKANIELEKGNLAEVGRNINAV